YLFLDESAYARVGPLLKVLPPIRARSDQEALWRALAAGAIDCVATDHAPHEVPAGTGTKDVSSPVAAAAGSAGVGMDVEAELRPVWEGTFGMSGVQTLLPLLLDHALTGACSVADVVRWTSAAPARAYGL